MSSMNSSPLADGDYAPQRQTLAHKASLPLTCVSVVVRQNHNEIPSGAPPSARELVGVLPHAVAAISAFLDGPDPFWTIPKACAYNHMPLLLRLARHEPDDMNKHYRAYLCRRGLNHAIRNDNMAIVQWLCCEYCPTVIVWKVIEDAATLGRTAILDWLTAHFGSMHIQSSVELADLAAMNGHLETVQWIYDSLAEGKSYWPSSLIGAAVKKNDLAMVQWLFKHHPPTQQGQDWLQSAIQRGNLEIVQFLYANDAQQQHGYDALAVAAGTGNLAMVEWVHSLPNAVITSAAMECAASKGHFEIVKWLYLNRDTGDNWNTTAIDGAAQSGHLEMLKWLHENQVGTYTKNAMDYAAANGHLEVVKWLHENRTEGCSPEAMRTAAQFGHLHVVEWLDANRWEGYPRSTVSDAAACGHVHVVKWLYERNTPDHETTAMDLAATFNRLDMVKWLHANRDEGCSTRAMNGAASHNCLDMVKWLHENRTEGCTTRAMDYAGSLEVVRWLHENRGEGCTSSAMDNAILVGEFELVLFLHTHRNEGCTRGGVENALRFQEFEIFQWLCEMYPDKVDLSALKRSSLCSGVRMQALLEQMTAK